MVVWNVSVLVVDDGATDRMRWDLIGRLYGLRVRTAASSKEAMAQLAADRPDLVLMDLDMPGTDGVTATRILRDDPDLRDLTVVCHSGSPRVDDAMETGLFDGRLPKDLDDAALADGVRTIATATPRERVLRA